MRTTPLVGEKLWFGPKRFGWGWSPVSWEGWLASALTAGVAIAFSLAGQPIPTVLIVGGLVALCILKGTSPGSASDNRALRRGRRPPL